VNYGEHEALSDILEDHREYAISLWAFGDEHLNSLYYPLSPTSSANEGKLARDFSRNICMHKIYNVINSTFLIGSESLNSEPEPSILATRQKIRTVFSLSTPAPPFGSLVGHEDALSSRMGTTLTRASSVQSAEEV